MQAINSKPNDADGIKHLASACSSAIGIIIPPPEIKAIIDKTSTFVAKNGITFEEKIRTNEVNNPKFNFLNSNDPYFLYYRNNLAILSKGKPLIEPIKTEEPILPTKLSQKKIDEKTNFEKITAVEAKVYKPEKGDALIKSTTKFIDVTQVDVPTQYPNNYEFIFDPPNMPIGDIEIIRMTAQFVAKGGQNFLKNLMEREKRNYFFDFIKPQHACFNFFNAMVNQYSKIITPSVAKLKELDESSYDLTKVITRIKDRYYYEKMTSENVNKEAEELERERIAFAQIDWNDFVIVEQINFKEDDKLTLPEPVTLESLGDRIIQQQRLLEEQAEAETKTEDKASVPEEDKPIIVVKDYDPKKTKKPPIPTSTAPLGTVDNSLIKSGIQMMISPITGELIPSDSLAEHMKVSLLDPRWKEEKKRLQEEKQKQEEVFVTGDTVSSYLKDLAQHRSDIFGDNAVETQIGKRMNKENNLFNANSIDSKSIFANPSAIAKPYQPPVEQKIQNVQLQPPMNTMYNKHGPMITLANNNNFTPVPNQQMLFPNMNNMQLPMGDMHINSGLMPPPPHMMHGNLHPPNIMYGNFIPPNMMHGNFPPPHMLHDIPPPPPPNLPIGMNIGTPPPPNHPIGVNIGTPPPPNQLISVNIGTPPPNRSISVNISTPPPQIEINASLPPNSVLSPIKGNTETKSPPKNESGSSPTSLIENKTLDLSSSTSSLTPILSTSGTSDTQVSVLEDNSKTLAARPTNDSSPVKLPQTTGNISTNQQTVPANNININQQQLTNNNIPIIQPQVPSTNIHMMHPPITHPNIMLPPQSKPAFINSQIYSEINIFIQIGFPPDVAIKHNWKFESHILPYRIDLAWPVSRLKAMITESSGMPGGKQKLSTLQGSFLKDSNNIGFYHLVENSMLMLPVKERGGR